MSWNESGNGKNPWDRGSGQDGPPDLDKIVRDWQKKLTALLGGGKKGNNGNGNGAGDNAAPLVGVLVLVLIGWGLTGLYQVDDAERGVIQRFGAYSETTLPGLRWHLPWPVEMVDKVNISEIKPFPQTTSMLTADENIVIVDMVVQYRKTDPIAYLFDVLDPESTLGDASESAIREVIGKSEMDYILGAGRVPVSEETRKVIQSAMDEYGGGIEITKVNLRDVNFPNQVDQAVQDAIKAREDKERLKFEAESYANDIVPRARGNAVRRIQDAEAYQDRVIANAEGEAARFTAQLKEYAKAPEVTRERMYIDAIEYVYSNSNKVLLDAQGSGNLLYLPVDKLMEKSSSSATQGRDSSAPEVRSQLPSERAVSPDNARSRGAR
jgi:membrane protease subunit HflK